MTDLVSLSFESKREAIAKLNQEAYLADGFEDALIGYSQAEGGNIVAVYSYDKCIRVLVDRDGMEEEEALEYFEFNVVGAYMGPNTPLFVYHELMEQPE